MDSWDPRLLPLLATAFARVRKCCARGSARLILLPGSA